MSTLSIIIIVCAVILVAIIALIVFIRLQNKKRFNKLQEDLKKYKAENEKIDNDDQKIFISEENGNINETKIIPNLDTDVKIDEQKGPIIEDYVPEEQTMNVSPMYQKREKRSYFAPKRFENNIRPEVKPRKNEVDDFDEFMNEHSYSRRVLNNDIMGKIKNLPPEVKAIILSNVFNKHDED